MVAQYTFRTWLNASIEQLCVVVCDHVTAVVETQEFARYTAFTTKGELCSLICIMISSGDKSSLIKWKCAEAFAAIDRYL